MPKDIKPFLKEIEFEGRKADQMRKDKLISKLLWVYNRESLARDAREALYGNEGNN